MRFPKLLMFMLVAFAHALVAAFVGGLLFTAFGADGALGFKAVGATHLAVSVFRAFVPGLSLPSVAFNTLMPPAANIPSMTTFSPRRAQLDAISRDLLAAGLPNVIPGPGYLRSEVVLGAAQNQVTFEMAANQNNGQAISPTENRLKVNDAFYPTHYGVFFYTYTTATARTRYLAQLQSFGNDAVFGLNAPEVDGSYNGFLSLRVNDRVYFDSVDMLRFKYVTPAQEGLAVSTAASNNAYFQSGWNTDILPDMADPLVRLNGQFSNKFTVTFPDSLDFTKVAGQTMVAVMFTRGWLVQNAGTANWARK